MSVLDDNYSVKQGLANGSHEYYKRFVEIGEAMAAAHFLITTEAAQFGLTRSVVVENGCDAMLFYWKYGEGVVHQSQCPNWTPEEMQQIEAILNAPTVTNIAEAHWRNMLIAGESNTYDVVVSFHAMLKEMCTDLGENAVAFRAAVEIKCGELLKQYEGTNRDRMALGYRLGVLPEQHRVAAEGLLAPESPRTTYAGGLGGMAVRTAVRATIWESVRAVFRAFR
jgi:hypothetical protein